MINIVCSECKKNCCGEIKKLRPVLIPSEEKKFKSSCDVINTPFGDMFVLKRKRNGLCVFFDRTKRKCAIYDKRPLECRLYPILMTFSEDNGIGIIIDKRFCKSLNTLKYDDEKILKNLKNIKLSDDWVKAYKTLNDF